MKRTKRFLQLCLMTVLGTYTIQAKAQIPPVITGTYTVSGIEECWSDCVVPANCTLIIPAGAMAGIHGDLEIQGHGAVIVDGGTLRIGDGGRIRLRGLQVLVPPYLGGRLYASNNALISALKPGIDYWKGIEAERGLLNGTMHGMFYADETTIELADYGFTNYNSDFDPNLTSGGGFRATSSVMQNHRFNHLRIQNALDYEMVGGTDPYETMVASDVRFNRCTFRTTDSVPYNPELLVSLINCRPVGFFGCTFIGKTDDYTTTTAIQAVNSGLRAQKHVIVDEQEPNVLPTSFRYFRNAINVNNALEIDRRVFVRDTRIIAKNGIYLSGCLNPLIVSNITETLPGVDNTDFVSLYMINSTGYRVEANTFQYNVGIVSHQSGTANNTIYRNFITSGVLGVQALGINRSTSQQTGLKILCNQFLADVNTHPYDITVMNDGSINDGIHDLQFVENISQLSAGNRFTQYSGDPGIPANYFFGDGTNDLLAVKYGWFIGTPEENPVYRNFPNTFLADQNTCPVVNTGALPGPFPFGLFVQQLQALESEITQLENGQGMAAANPEQLSYWLQRHTALIDSVVIPYQERGYTDSVLLAYQQVTKGGHHYRLMEAAAHASLQQYPAAINVLNGISAAYSLTGEEQTQISYLEDMYQVLDWLHQNNNDWAGLSAADHALVGTYAVASDAFYAGAIARSLLAKFEDNLYEPVFVVPKQTWAPSQPQVTINNTQEGIYPNPLNNQLHIQLEEEGCRLVLTDALGRIVLEKELPRSYSVIDTRSLVPGTYFAVITKGETILMQQKLIKQ